MRVGEIGDHEVVTAMTGMGTSAAAEVTSRLLDSTEVDHVVVVGIAGAVDAGTSIGEVVVPETVIDAESGDEYRSDPWGGLPVSGKVLTSDELIVDRGELARLHRRGVVALDMETAAVARACARRCSWSAVRAISDRATDGVVDDTVIGLLNQDGSANPAAVARLLLTRPWEIGRLVRLARGMKTATAAAASTAMRALDGR